MKKVCSFCGRGENEVKLLISGLNGQICENCVEQAYQIINDNLREAPVAKKKGKAAEKPENLKVPKPKEIKEYLDQYVIGSGRCQALSGCGCLQPLQAFAAARG